MKQLESNILRYGLYEDEKIWTIAYNQQRKWTKPDWDVQNLLASLILRYLKDYYISNAKIKRVGN